MKKQKTTRIRKYGDGEKPAGQSKYARKQKQGLNHSRHIVPVTHCPLCNQS